MNPVLARLGGNPLAAIQDLKVAMATEGPLHDFSVGDPIEPTPAFVRQALIDGLDEISQYPTVVGLPALRAAVAGWIKRRFAVEVDPDTQVLPTSGSKEAIFHIPLALIDPGSQRRATLWAAPGYPIYERGALFAGGDSDPVGVGDVDGWRLELASLPDDRLARAAIAWVNYPHNPTGAAVDAAFYRRSLEAARAAGVILASDECYADVYPAKASPPPSLLQEAGDDLTGVLVAFSLSKRSGMTGYRSGALVGDARLIGAQRLMRPNLGTASPDFVQRAAISAWADDEHAEQRRAVFDAKREVMLPFLSAHGFRLSGSEAAFYLWVAAPGGDDAAYAEALLRERVVVTPGRAFGPAGRGWLRLALVPTAEGCEEAVRRWRDAVESGRLPGHD